MGRKASARARVSRQRGGQPSPSGRAGAALGPGPRGVKWQDLPPDETPVLLVRFTAKASAGVIKFVREQLLAHGLLIVAEERRRVVGSHESTLCLAITATRATLEEEAESMGFVKLTLDGTMEDFVVEARDDFVGIERPDFFTQGERAQLVQSELEFLRVDNKAHSKVLAALGVKHDPGGVQTLRHVLESNELIDCVAPMHDEVVREELMWKTMRIALDHTIFSPVQELRDYYGEGVAFYFVWLDFLTAWLCVPAAASALLYGVRYYRNDTIDTCSLTPFYGVFIFIWAISYLRFYQRHEARCAWNWGTYSEGTDPNQHLAVRPQFEGQLRVSPVTGRTEKYYPHSLRVGKYIVSGCVTAVLLVGAFFVMICSLNLQGYIQPAHDRVRWPRDEDHPFYIGSIAQYAEPGALFDPASDFMSLVPVVLHVVTILILNGQYRKVAERLTEWENHETVIAFQDSLILKRFLWEAFDAFIGLCYLAFYENNMLKLRDELMMVFSVDTFRRILCECVIPMTLKFVERTLEDRARRRAKSQTTSDRADPPKNPNRPAPSPEPAQKSTQLRQRKGKEASPDVDALLARDRSTDLMDQIFEHDEEDVDNSHFPMTAEAGLDVYEQFDDLLEMTIQFGYVTLFASAFPAAAVIAVIANVIEIRSDALKLARVCRKPRSLRRANVGTWHTLMTAIVCISALTNCLIFGVTSQQLMQFAPNWFEIDADGEQQFALGFGRYIVLTVFVVERLLVILGLLVFMAIPPVPEDVTEAIKHRAFVWAEKSRKARIGARSDTN